MVNNFDWGLDSPYIAHYGVPHGHGPNGGSGRYPWGSGAKWGKTPLGRATDRIKKFFGKNRVEKSDAEREIKTSLAAESEKAHEVNERIADMILTSYTDKLDKERGNDNPHLSDSDRYKNRLSELMAEQEKDNPYYQIPEYREKANRYKELETLVGRYFEPKFQAMEDNYQQGSQKYKELETQYKPIFEEYKKVSKEVLDETNKWDEKLKQLNSQKSAESHEADRKAALESGDRNQILKYFSESSNEELQRAINKAGMMDSLNKSISDSKPKTQSAEELTKAQKEEYIKSALGSGDIKQILSVASDSSVTNNDLVNALNKANTMTNLNKQLNPSKVDKAIEVADKFKSVLDKGLGYYNTTSNIWNTVAANYNNTQAVKNDPTKALGYMLQAPNLNQKKDEKKDGEGKKQKEKDASQDKRAQDIQNQLNGLKKSIEALSTNQKTEAPKPAAQNQPTKQASPQIKNEVKSAVQKVSDKKIDAAEKYATSLFPNDDNGPMTSSSKKSDTLKTYYSFLESQETPKWQSMYQSSLDSYDGYNFDWD